jgi:LuxR family transcriptional regulator, maltose regulon positive regulatory protein
VIAPALVTLASALAQTGRFDEAERWLDRADRTLRAEVEPALGCLLWGVRGALHRAAGRFEDAATSYAQAVRLGTALVQLRD